MQETKNGKNPSKNQTEHPSVVMANFTIFSSKNEERKDGRKEKKSALNIESFHSIKRKINFKCYLPNTEISIFVNNP